MECRGVRHRRAQRARARLCFALRCWRRQRAAAGNVPQGRVFTRRSSGRPGDTGSHASYHDLGANASSRIIPLVYVRAPPPQAPSQRQRSRGAAGIRTGIGLGSSARTRRTTSRHWSVYRACACASACACQRERYSENPCLVVWKLLQQLRPWRKI